MSVFRIAASLLISLILSYPSVSSAQKLHPGADLFVEKGCSGCHSVDGNGGNVGPTLDHVGDRYSAEWLYRWLEDPAIVKPGTAMPKMELTDRERAMMVFFLESRRSGNVSPLSAQVSAVGVFTRNTPEENPSSPENAYLDLGVGGSYVLQQRFTLQDQIQSFIPPLYAPAFTQSAFVLPPGALRSSVTLREISIDEGDVAGQQRIGARFINFDLERSFLDFDFFLGLNRNYTLRINVPIVSSEVSQTLNPGFMDSIVVFPTASTSELGDVSVFLKKKFFDQGNFPVSFAGVAALRFPTGSDDEKFNGRTTVTTPMGNGLLPLPAVDSKGMPIPDSADGTFRRFSDTGVLPAPLQPGLGTLGGSLGIFATRILEGNTFLGQGAFHAGILYEFRPDHGGVDPGDLATAFVSFVKPVIGDQVSLDLSYIAQHQQTDSYAGLMAVPSLPPVMPPMSMPRPSFSGGTTQLVGATVVISPNPLFQVTVSGLFRVGKPALGPSPDNVIRLGFQYTLASGLFKKGN